MQYNELTFEALPQAISQLMEKVDKLQAEIQELKRVSSEPPAEGMIGIDEACKILHLAKSTVYSLTQKRRLPFYQPGKMLQFKRSELLKWIEDRRNGISDRTVQDISEVMQRGVTHKPKGGRW